jgi:hypothetical protein
VSGKKATPGLFRLLLKIVLVVVFVLKTVRAKIRTILDGMPLTWDLSLQCEKPKLRIGTSS